MHYNAFLIFFQLTQCEAMHDPVLPKSRALLRTQQSHVVLDRLAERRGSGQHAHSHPYCQRAAPGDGQNTQRDRFRQRLLTSDRDVELRLTP